MGRLNIQMTPAFERDLKRYMRAKGFSTQSEAVRAAIEEALQEKGRKPKVSFKDLVGIGVPREPSPRRKWLTEDDLWGDNGRR
jgi:hypothetical protein